ncbi:MAG: hypothetical protein GWP08_14360 [Nitrospiraceae bacterium]|nr:hypothetical protein [Nitrospiraceae bacterium]
MLGSWVCLMPRGMTAFLLLFLCPAVISGQVALAGEEQTVVVSSNPEETPSNVVISTNPAETGADVVESSNTPEEEPRWGMKESAVPADDWSSLRKESEVPKTPGYVTNFFYETPVREALSEMGLQSETTIVADESVQGLVTCDLQNVPLKEALRIVLALGNYAYRDMDGFLLVGSANPESPTFMKLCESSTVRLSHIQAKDALSMLAEPLQKFAKTAEGINTILITAPADVSERIAMDLALLDQAPRQVVLEAIILVTEAGQDLDLGADWNWPSVSAGTFTNTEFHGRKKPPNESPWQWGLQVGYTPNKEFTEQLMVTLNFLTQSVQATVIANPQVMVQDGEEASIKVTTEEYFNIVTEGFYTRNELEKVESGTSLTITPTLRQDNTITLNLQAEVSDVIARGQDNLPVVTRREASSTVRVEDGGTAVIAGLIKNTSRISSQGVPGLRNVPVLGHAFGSDRNSDISRQLYIFVTPRIVAEDKDSVQNTAQPPAFVELAGEEFRSELESSLRRTPRKGGPQ